MAAGDVPHRDGDAERRGEAAAGHCAGLLAGGVPDGGAVADHAPPLRQEPDAAARGAVGELALDPRRAGHPEGRRSPGAEGPCQAGLHRAGAGVDVVAVEAETGLEAEAVARAEARRPDLGPGEQRLRDRGGGRAVAADLEAVFAGVAAPAERAGHPAHVELAVGERRQFEGGRRQLRQRRGGQGSLEREEGPLGPVPERERGQAGPEPGEVRVDPRRVQDHEHVVGPAGHQEVVHDAAVVVGDDCVAGAAGRQRLQAGRDQGLELAGGVFAGNLDLAHVGHVEEGRRFPGPAMFGEDALVLDGELPAGKRDQLAPEGHVQVMQRCGPRGLVRRFRQERLPPARTNRRRARPPLSWDLRDSSDVRNGCRIYPFGGRSRLRRSPEVLRSHGPWCLRGSEAPLLLRRRCRAPISPAGGHPERSGSARQVNIAPPAARLLGRAGGASPRATGRRSGAPRWRRTCGWWRRMGLRRGTDLRAHHGLASWARRAGKAWGRRQVRGNIDAAAAAAGPWLRASRPSVRRPRPAAPDR